MVVTVDIVVIDDDAMIIALINRYLQNSGYSYRCFSIPDEAIQYLSTSLPKILFVDYFMPKTNGLDLIESLPMPKSSDTPKIFLCSSIDLPHDVQQTASKHGVTPILKDTLMQKEYIEGLCTQLT